MIVRYGGSLADIQLLDGVVDVPLNPRALPVADGRPSALLSYIDPYGDTAFNYLQIDQFLEEWTALELSALTDLEREAYAEIVRLAQRAKDGRGFLIFIGD